MWLQRTCILRRCSNISHLRQTANFDVIIDTSRTERKFIPQNKCDYVFIEVSLTASITTLTRAG